MKTLEMQNGCLMENKREYQAPKVKTVDFRVERGFAGSDPQYLFHPHANDGQVEQYSIGNGLSVSGNRFGNTISE